MDELGAKEPGVRHWPAHDPPAPELAVSLCCAGCGQPWNVHPVLSGFRLRCDCGGWIELPATEEDALEDVASIGSGLDGRAATAVQANTSLAQASPRPRPAKRGDRRRRAAVDGELIEAGVASRRRWIDRSLLELVALLACFWLPALAIEFFWNGREEVLLMPFADLVSGLLILLVGLGSASYAFDALRSARVRYWIEALVVAAGAALLATGFVELLAREGWHTDWLGEVVGELGLAMSIFAIGLCPAVFEELAFRGIFHGRMTAVFGTRQGILITGIAFGLAHGLSPALPLLAGLGVYLSWLRHRSGSLLPGMVLHFAYNSILVVTAGGGGG